MGACNAASRRIALAPLAGCVFAYQRTPIDPAFKIASLFERGSIVKTACFVAKSPRLGNRKITITGQASREIMREHLRAAYMGGAASGYGVGFMMKPAANNPNEAAAAELAGEYIGLFFDQSAPHDAERQIAERIQVRRAAFWERIL